MGTSCSCNIFSESNEELDIIKERKGNRDFFIDYNKDNLNTKENLEIENKVKKIPTNSMNSNNDHFGIFSTQSFSNINNTPPVFKSHSYTNNYKEGLTKENFNQEDEKEIIFEKEQDIDDGKAEIIEKEKEVKTDNKTQINIKPKKFLIKHSDNLEDFNYDTNISKTKVIYSSSIDIISKKKYENQLISEEEYNLTPEDKYSKTIFELINNLRTNPKEVANLIEENIKYIVVDENNELFFKKNKIKYQLSKGYQVFNETINILNNLEPMNKLIYRQNITIKIPDNENDIIGLDYMEKEVNKLQNEGNHIFSFWKEKIKDPEVAFLMMIVDDNNKEIGLKRKDLINPDTLYIGISSVEFDNNFACFITLSNRK